LNITTSETFIVLTPESLYTILGEIAALAVGATAWITWRLGKLSERVNNTIKTVDKLDDRLGTDEDAGISADRTKLDR
jgi:hypothetical protein